MVANPLKEIEEIHARTFGRGARTIGVTGPQEKSGSSTIAKSLATRCALSGQSSLLVNIATHPEEQGQSQTGSAWKPGENGASQNIHRANAGYDILPIQPHGADRYRYRDARELQQLLQTDLNRYSQIVIDLPPSPDDGRSAIPSGVGAASCDAVVLVCRTGAVTKQAVNEAIDYLANSEAKLAGIVMNDQNAPTLAQEFKRILTKLEHYLPQNTKTALFKMLDDSQFLNRKM